MCGFLGPCKGRRKSEGVNVHTRKTKARVEVELHSFLISALAVMSGVQHRRDHFKSRSYKVICIYSILRSCDRASCDRAS
jgi:hypothetical protein